MNRDPDRRPEPFSASDFMPRFGQIEEADEELSFDDAQAKLMAIAAAFGAIDTTVSA